MGETELGVDGPQSPYFLGFLASMVYLYYLLPGATISTKIFSKPLRKSNITLGLQITHKTRTPWCYQLSKAEAFASIAYCESGSCDPHPTGLKEVFALSCGNSIFVSGELLCDPAESTKDYEIRRLVGNIGRPGIALLIPPPNPRLRESRDDSWRIINHQPFDGILKDSFEQTTMHLSFTDYIMPLSTESHGNRDTEAYLLESVVSVHDRGEWIGDVSMLPMFKDRGFEVLSSCEHHTGMSLPPDLIAVNNWEELLETPE
jgi:hypothetical protein